MAIIIKRPTISELDHRHFWRCYNEKSYFSRSCFDVDIPTVVPSTINKMSVTAAKAYVLWNAIANLDSFSLIATANVFQSQQYISEIMQMYERLPTHMKPSIEQYGRTMIHFSNGCRITAQSGNTMGRGCTVNLLYLTFDPPPDILASVMPCIWTGGLAIKS